MCGKNRLYFDGGLGLKSRGRHGQSRVRGITPSLLAQAFRGALVSQDPADEPASVLLERIRNRAAGVQVSV